MPNAHPILGLFTTCEQMKWAHLPNGGDIADQDPVLWDMIQYIFAMRSKKQAEDAKNKGNKGTNPARPPRRRKG